MIEINDLVFIKHERGTTSKSLAVVLDKRRGMSQVVYTDNPAAKAKPDPFWIYDEHLILIEE